MITTIYRKKAVNESVHFGYKIKKADLLVDNYKNNKIFKIQTVLKIKLLANWRIARQVVLNIE